MRGALFIQELMFVINDPVMGQHPDYDQTQGPPRCRTIRGGVERRGLACVETCVSFTIVLIVEATELF